MVKILNFSDVAAAAAAAAAAADDNTKFST
eukprot:SAG31_NODE_614_length_13525_cov_4.312230_10_plen_30_part_00